MLNPSLRNLFGDSKSWSFVLQGVPDRLEAVVVDGWVTMQGVPIVLELLPYGGDIITVPWHSVCWYEPAAQQANGLHVVP